MADTLLPPLPPRNSPPRERSPSPSATSCSSAASTRRRSRADTVHLTPWARTSSQSPRIRSSGAPPPYQEGWNTSDPRSSSMQSLVPVEQGGDNRRKLLLVYIHGFLGNETSFKSFPAHVHNVITLTLAESHVVHTKIYPRYKSRRVISFAVDDFSNWLSPHESTRTDVILLGHSLGGILAAEAALLPSRTSNSSEICRHRILGVMAFDTPFLGMHPGVIGSGIESLFRPAPDLLQPKRPDESERSTTPGTASTSLRPAAHLSSDPFCPSENDPNFNPSFDNDVIWSPAKRGWESALHFVNKHSDALFKASKQYVKSHLEFGGCLVDYVGLRKRYERMRALEDVDELARQRDSEGRLLRRVRFVNYYSASTGRIRSARSPGHSSSNSREASMTELDDLSGAKSKADDDAGDEVATPSTEPRLSLEEHIEHGVVAKPLDNVSLAWRDSSDTRQDEITRHPKMGGDDNGSCSEEYPLPDAIGVTGLEVTSAKDDSLIEGLPPAPPDFDASLYSAKDTLKLAEKEHARQAKAYERAKRDREKTLRDREKMIKKREKAAEKAREKQAKLEKKNKDISEKEQLKRKATLNPQSYDRQLQRDTEEQGATGSSKDNPQPRKKKRDRKFCALPPKNPITGERDRCWIRVYMEGVDEVVAHTTLFDGVGERYEMLVGDTASHIEDWVHEDNTKRTLLGEQGYECS